MRYFVLIPLLILATLKSPSVGIHPTDTVKSELVYSPQLQEPTDSVLHYLIRSTVSDFRTQRPSDHLKFKEVYFGHITSDSKKKTYLLCGKFLSTKGEGSNKWTQFATIRTSGFEIYLGANIYCQDPSFTLENKNDLSSVLQSGFDDIPKTK
jgi:hypothetical protein